MQTVSFSVTPEDLATLAEALNHTPISGQEALRASVVALDAVAAAQQAKGDSLTLLVPVAQVVLNVLNTVSVSGIDNMLRVANLALRIRDSGQTPAASAPEVNAPVNGAHTAVPGKTPSKGDLRSVPQSK